MITKPSLRWMRLALLALVTACAGEPTSAPAPIAAPQLSYNDDDDDDDDDDRSRGGRWFNEDSDPDLQWIARFKTRPAPPNPLHDHAMIGPAGGSLRVGDFEIIVPPGAVDRNTNFRIKVPVDARASMSAFAEFSPHMIFRKPVTLRVPAASTEVVGTPWVMWWSGSFWLPLHTEPTVDGRAEARVWHFSVYGASKWGKGITTLGG